MSYAINYEHEVEDQVFFMHENKVNDGNVEEIQINVKKPNVMSLTDTDIRIIYLISYVEDGNTTRSTILKQSEEIFATKQELLDSL